MNNNENSNQHQLVAMLILFIGLAVGIYLVFQKANPAYMLYQEVQAKTQSVEASTKELETLKAKREAFEREEKVSTKPIYKNELKITDQISSFGIMFEDVIQAAKYNGLKLRSISYQMSPADDPVQAAVAEDYNVCNVSLKLIGNYSQFRSYFQDVYNYPYLINLSKIRIEPYEKNAKMLVSDVVVTLYSTKSEAQKEAYRAALEAENKGDEAVQGGVGSAMQGM